VWWKARRWVALLELIDQLPATSRTQAAMLNDPDIAADILAHEDGDDAETWSPPLTDWNTGTALQAETRDLLLDAVRLLAAIRSGIPVVQQEKLRTPPKIGGKPFPRPLTAVDKARRAAEIEAYNEALAVFSPHALN